MGLNRKIIATALVGFLIGSGIGIAFAYAKRQERLSEPSPTAEDALTLVCTGGNRPSILITWPEKATPLMAGLQRAININEESAWVPVFTSGQQPAPSGHEDRDVSPDTTYHYRVIIQKDTVALSANIHTNAVTCAD